MYKDAIVDSVIAEMKRREAIGKRQEMSVSYAIDALLLPLDQRDFYWGYVTRLRKGTATIRGPTGFETVNLNGDRDLEKGNIVIVNKVKGTLIYFPTKYTE